MTPLAWYWALLVWGWALAWFLVNDRAKLLTYWLLDRVRAEAIAAAVEPASVPETAPKTAPVIPAPPAAKPAANPAAQHHAASPPRDTKPRPDPGQSPGVDNAKVATLMDTKLGEVLLAAALKDPAGAGLFIAQAIDDAESPEAVAGSPGDKATMPAVPTPKAAE